MATEPAAAPVIILSYQHSGARFVQEAIAEGTDLACTAGTGILPECAVAMTAWSRIDGRAAGPSSPLALSSIRALVSVQLTAILARSGKQRWCELATSGPSGAHAFLRIFPQARFVCVHRAWGSVVSAAISARPREPEGTPLARFTARYPGNYAAAVAAYWAWATERLLAFEAANPRCTSRLRYEDVTADPDVLDGIRAAIRVDQRDGLPRWGQLSLPPEEERRLQEPDGVIPADLRERIGDLEARLGYPMAVGRP